MEHAWADSVELGSSEVAAKLRHDIEALAVTIGDRNLRGNVQYRHLQDAMLSLETIGYYFDGPRGAESPFPFNVFSPVPGDLLAIVGNRRSRWLAEQVAASFGRRAGVRGQPVALPGFLPGVKSSDHWSFWKQGYPAVMLTDTGPLRYRHYHRPTDTIEKIDFARLSAVVAGLGSALGHLSSAPLGDRQRSSSTRIVRPCALRWTRAFLPPWSR